MPVDVACLVPSAPLLLPRLTGDQVPEVTAVREAVTAAVAALVGLERVVVVAPRTPGTLAGFGAPGGPDPLPPAQPPGAEPGAGTGAGAGGDTSWPHALAAELLDAAGASAARRWLCWDDATALPSATRPAGTGLLLLADGSRTRGPRAPGGQDARGEQVDAELLDALHAAREPVVPDAAAVGATAGPAVALLASLASGPGAVEVLHADAPLGVCYLVAVVRRGPR